MNHFAPFSLQSVLDVRSGERQQRRGELAETLRDEAVLLASQQAVDLQLAVCEEARRAAGERATLDVLQLTELEQRRAALCQQRDQLVRDRAAIADRIDQQRQTLIEADRGVRLLEKLRERRRYQALREQRRREPML